MAKKILCPLLKKPCVKEQCMWYTQLTGSHPQTGQPVNEHGCAMTWLPILLVENSQQQRQTGAAIESFRNEVVNENQALALLSMSASGISHEQ